MSLNTQLPNGVILAWPTPIYRKVWPGDGERISIAFNVLIANFTITDETGAS